MDCGSVEGAADGSLFVRAMADYGLKLHYFPARSRGESLRMLLHHAKIPFENVLVSGPEFMKQKSSLPTGQLPVLEVKGRRYAESGSMLRFLGRVSDLTPDDPQRLLAADSAYEAARGLGMIDPIVNRFEGELLRETYVKYFEQLPGKLKYLSEMLGDALYYGGETPCYADFGVWHYLDNTETVKPGAVTPENLKSWMQRMAELDGMRSYLSERPEIRDDRRALITPLVTTSAL